MIRVLIVDKTAGLDSSHERHQALARQKDFQFHVLGPVHWIESGREIAWQPREDMAYTFHPGRMFFKDYYARAGYYNGLRQALQKSRPHIIQLLEEPWAVSTAQTLALARAFAPKAKIVFYTWENIYRPWNYPSRLSRLYRWIDKAAHRQSSGAVCATEGARDVLLQKHFDKPIEVIPYGIPHFFFEETPAPVRANPHFTIGYIGRLMHMKGIDLLLHALTRLPDCRLRLCGSGPDEKDYREQARLFGVESRVEWLAPVPEREVPGVLRSLDAFVLPSRRVDSWQEQLGRAAIEAMAVGVPVIGSSSGAIPEVVGNCGLIFEENSLERLVHCIQQLKENTELRCQFAFAGQERARQHYTWPRFAAQLCKFYLSLLIKK